MLLTPSCIVALISGLVVWALFWFTLSKLATIPACRPYATKFIRWVNEHQLFCLIVAEVINFGTHGIATPIAVMFAAGGTLVNSFIVLVAIPATIQAKRFMQWKAVA